MQVVALAGNPNVGKSTLFNALTGMNQHTGNWPGKTVALAQGEYHYKGEAYRLVDLPGAYSLVSHSPEEHVAEEFLEEGSAACTVVVCDATCLERSLILVLQVLALTPKVVVCVNLMDEAERAGIRIDLSALQKQLGVPVTATSANRQKGLSSLSEQIRNVCDGYASCIAPRGAIHGKDEAESDRLARAFVLRAQEIAAQCVLKTRKGPAKAERLDNVLLHRIGGYAVMLLLLLGIFWLTIEGANYPSQGLQWCFDHLGVLLRRGARALALPAFLCGALLDGVYETVARVVSVMLPPMAIFFPLFTLLEDFGYLPRVAFLMDHRFRKSGACGKQSLTLCMGLGCNAVGVTGCRIIDSPRERLIAVLTNAFVPCNGRFPGLIFLIALSFTGNSTLIGAAVLTLCLLLSVGMTLCASKLLCKTVLKGEPSSFVLELPPYRKPQIGQVLIRSVCDRTLFVLGRAAAVAAPAGLLIWTLANLPVGNRSLLSVGVKLLQTPGVLLGMNGAVLLAFLLGSPANELVLPILMMVLTAGSSLGSESNAAMTQILQQSGWSWKQSLCTIVFFLFHWPCTTTLLTIRKETGSLRWTFLSVLLPTAFGCVLCLLLSQLLRLIP